MGEGIDRRYWFLCSVYGTEDSPYVPQIDVVPNPNNGTMSLIFANMEGKVDAKLYNTTGILVDEFTLNLNSESRHPYYLGDYPNGVYLLVFNHKGNLITRKVVVMK